MCVIIDKDPGVVFPSDKLEIACEINKDGFGLVVLNKNGMIVERSTAKNDFKAIEGLLNKFKDNRVLLHLRHATVGEVSLANSHPFFPVSSKKGNGQKVSIGFMHNGTMYDYKPDTGNILSDSHIFNKELLMPYLNMAVRATSPSKLNKILFDPLLAKILKKEAGFSNVLVLFDNFGNRLRINEARGHQDVGWWSSNDYSFKETHQRYNYNGSQYDWTHGAYGNHNSGGFSQNALPWPEVPPQQNGTEAWNTWEKDLEKDKSSNQSTLQTLPAVVVPASDLIDETVLHHEIKEFMAKRPKWIYLESVMSIKNLAETRKKFIERADLKDILDIGTFSRENLIDMCENFSAAAADCLIDALYEIKTLRETIEKTNVAQ